MKLKLPNISQVATKLNSGRFLWAVLAALVFAKACWSVVLTNEQAFTVIITIVYAYFNRKKDEPKADPEQR